MSRYIDKDTLLNRIVSLEQLARKRVYDTPTNSPCYERYVAQMQDREHIISIIKAMPTADVVEVRHGEWKLEHETYGKMRCSICEKECPTERKPDPYEDYQMTDFYVTSPYCPRCGAKMDGERREE